MKATGPNADRRLIESLTLTAYQMLRFGTKRRKMQGSHCEGEVVSDLETICFVGTSAIRFVADFDTSKGTHHVTFLMTKRSLGEVESSPEYQLVVDGEFQGEFPNPVRQYFGGN